MITALLLAAATSAVTSATPASTSVARPAPRAIRTSDMVADLYLPRRHDKAPAILLLGGSDGGLSKAVAGQARSLADHGYVVLHISYFGSPGQPEALKLIPIETFTRAIDWLKAQPEVAADRIGIMGESKGAEAALLVASRRPDLKIAVVGVPSSVVWPGIDRTTMVTVSSWTEEGRPVPFVPYGWSGEWKGIYALYAQGLAAEDKAKAGAIPVERAGAAIVMVCGEADGLWPSCPMARTVQDRLTTARYRHPVTLLAYPNAGHAAFGLPVDAEELAASPLGTMGGTSAGNIAARADGWPKILAALDASLMKGIVR